jgi:tRNA A-37 threonylcarbamoyl transferase component Bud32/tetratricopeptide (TPR) repeat protein
VTETTSISTELTIETLNQSLEGYRILREIGHGAMGIVYEAHQAGVGRRVAVKVLPPNLALRERTVKRFLREAEAMGRLAHANIVDVYEVGSVGELHFFTMQYAEGPPLDRVVKAGPLAIHEVVRIGIEVADALDHAHARGVLHRDVKPSNLLRNGERVVLTDFGLARPLDTEDAGSMTESGDLVGTPLYMSPEQISGGAGKIDGRSDVWGLGATIYELLVQRPPFTGSNAQGILNGILHKDPALLRKLRADVPQDLEAVVLKCLEKDVARRYSGAAALAEDLRAVQEGRSVSARTPRFFDPAVRWTRRHPAQAFVLAGALAVIGMLGMKWGQLATRLVESKGQLGEVQTQRDIVTDDKTLAIARYEMLQTNNDWKQAQTEQDRANAVDRILHMMEAYPYDDYPEIYAEAMQMYGAWAHELNVDREVLAWFEGKFSSGALTQRAALLTGLSHYEEALALHRRRALLNPRSPQPLIDAALVLRAIALQARSENRVLDFHRKLGEAIAMYQAALALAVQRGQENALATILIERARCRIDLDQKQTAEVDLLSALEHDPSRADGRALLMAARAQGDEGAPPLVTESAPRTDVQPKARPRASALEIDSRDLQQAGKNLNLIYSGVRSLLRAAPVKPPDAAEATQPGAKPGETAPASDPAKQDHGGS